MQQPSRYAITQSHPLRRQLKLTRDDREANRKREEESDVKLFALSFTAFFICFYTFLL
jgi:hypothetical protein